jgi:hypothetical protein
VKVQAVEDAYRQEHATYAEIVENAPEEQQDAESKQEIGYEPIGAFKHAASNNLNQGNGRVSREMEVEPATIDVARNEDHYEDRTPEKPGNQDPFEPTLEIFPGPSPGQAFPHQESRDQEESDGAELEWLKKAAQQAVSTTHSGQSTYSTNAVDQNHRGHRQEAHIVNEDMAFRIRCPHGWAQHVISAAQGLWRTGCCNDCPGWIGHEKPSLTPNRLLTQPDTTP